ncbi:type IV toxin-antitoxin system AbiEi family antitoxin domain-containing protein [Mycobacteroides abscessus]
MRVGVDRWYRLREIAAGQCGLFTAAQARHEHLQRYELARATLGGQLTRVHHGVYAFTDASADKHPFEDWAGQWLALDPKADIKARLDNPDTVISHHCAAEIQDLGTIVSAGRLHLTSARRIGVQSKNVSAYRRPIGERGRDWTIVAGLPVSSAGRIVEDLTAGAVDGSHIGTVIADAIAEGLLDYETVAKRLDPYAARRGEIDGAALVARFTAAAGLALA